MYRSRLWTMRRFAGFGTAEDTNWRFKEIIKSGGDDLSTAFDMPTLPGLDSDDPMSLGEVGRWGVAIDSLADIATLDEFGDGSMLDGVIKGIDENWFQGAIADSASELERTFNSGERVIVRVSGFKEGNDDDDDLDILRISNEDETRQRKRLDAIRHDRNQAAVDAALAKLRTEAADPEINLMPTLIEASQAYATLGEMMGTMADVFGRHTEVPVI